jgi:hypothetical protein
MLDTGATVERPFCIPDGFAARDVLAATEIYVPAL